MTPDISERAFEDAIEAALLRNGPDAPRGGAKSVRESPPSYGDDPLPGGYRKRRPEDYDRGLCLLPADVVDFLLATQPKGPGAAFSISSASSSTRSRPRTTAGARPASAS